VQGRPTRPICRFVPCNLSEGNTDHDHRLSCGNNINSYWTYQVEAGLQFQFPKRTPTLRHQVCKKLATDFVLPICCKTYKDDKLLQFRTTSTDRSDSNTRCGYEVPGMILVPAYVYTYSLLRGFIFEVLPWSSYVRNPTVGNISGTLL
jgi:hypothetical protein